MYQSLVGSPSLPEGGREEVVSQSSVFSGWEVSVNPDSHQSVVSRPQPVIIQTSFTQVSQFSVGLESLVSQPVASQPVISQLSVSQLSSLVSLSASYSVVIQPVVNLVISQISVSQLSGRQAVVSQPVVRQTGM